MSEPQETLTCAHCSKHLTPGHGEFYLVRIEAIGDPSTNIDEILDAEEIENQIKALLSKLAHTSDEDAMNQVFHRRILYLCYSCYQRWIANPTNKNDK